MPQANKHERFHYKTIAGLKQTAAELGITLPLSDDLSVLARPIDISGRTVPNRIAFQPMEGTDGTEDGSPGELTIRRYQRFAEGGAGLIWFEAVAVHERGRASAHQLMITDNNWEEYARLMNDMRERAMKANGYAPIIIMQTTVSGRYSKPTGKPAPRIMVNNPTLEDEPLPESCIVTDDELREYEEAYGRVAKLAERAGFDGIDVKGCHRYLVNETLSARTREGEYGGSFANRQRFIMNAYRAVKANVKRAFVTSRLNVYDGFVYPYGFGVNERDGLTPDLAEPVELIKRLTDEMDIPMINVTIGNPYRNPHVNRPYDNGAYIPSEHPLVGVDRMMNCVGEVKRSVAIPVMGSAFSYLRQHSAALAAGMIAEGRCDIAGFGRMAFAYPDFARDILTNGKLDNAKVCVTCGGCAALLRAGTPAGCVVRDGVYKR